MVSSKGLLGTLTASEVEFIAENELIQVMPSTTLGTLHMISDDFGPLRTNQLALIPLWLARQLKRSKLCRIIPPAWFNVDRLTNLIDQEGSNQNDFQPLPFHFIEIANFLLDCASEDLSQSEALRALIQRLRELRSAKIQQGLPLIDGSPLKLNNLGLFELNEIRPFLLMTLNQFVLLNMTDLEEQVARSRMFTNNSLNPQARSNLFSFSDSPNNIH